MILQAFRYMFPQIKWVPLEEYDLNQTTLKKGSKIMYRVDNRIMYGIVENVTKKNMEVTPLIFTRIDALTNCHEFSSAQLSLPTVVEAKDYVGQFMVTAGFVNKYVSLQLIKK